MKIKMNCYYKTVKYGMLAPGNIYDVDHEDGYALIKKKIDPQRTVAILMDSTHDQEKITKLKAKAEKKNLKKKKVEAKKTEQLVETNEKFVAVRKAKKRTVQKKATKSLEGFKIKE